MTVDKFGGALLVQSWREPLRNDDVFDLCDAAFGGQLGFDDVHTVWVHPRANVSNTAELNASENLLTGKTLAAAGVYRRASFLTATNAVDDSSPFGPDVFGRDLSDPALGFSFSELNLAYEFVPPRRFGDPSLYLDFRPTRRWIRRFVAKRAAAGSSVSALNAFAYTCGAGLAATAGGASRVLNTDHSATYLAYGAANYKLNGFEAGNQEGQGPRESESESTTQKTQTPKAEYSTSTRNARGAFDAYCEDFYPAVRQLAGLPMPGRQGRGGGRGGSKRGSKRGGRGAFGSSSPKEKKAKPPRPETFDLVILDPPTLTKTAYGAVDIENDYQSLAKPSALCVTPGGVLLATNHSHRIDVDDWLELVEKCVTKAGCVLSNVEVVSPDADDDDHPAMSDGKRPLKVAAFTLE